MGLSAHAVTMICRRIAHQGLYFGAAFFLTRSILMEIFRNLYGVHKKWTEFLRCIVQWNLMGLSGDAVPVYATVELIDGFLLASHSSRLME